MKKLLFVINSLGGGGAEKVLVTLLNQLCKKQYEITLIVIFGDGVYESAVDKRVKMHILFKHKRTDNNLKRYLYVVRNKILSVIPGELLYRLWIHGQYDCEIAYVEGLATKVVSGSKLNSKKMAWIHCNQEKLTYSTAFYRSLSEEIQCYQLFDEVYCVSDDIREAFSRKYCREAQVIRNAVDSLDILRKSKEHIESNNYKKDVINLVAVGRLAPVKGFDRLLRTIKKCIDNGFKVQLEIIGTGELKNELEELAASLGISAYVVWRGFTTNPYKYMVSADLFVCSSLSEGYSTSVIESLILGVPVLTTDCSGMREIFGEYDCGVIVDNTEEDLYQGLYRILNDSSLLFELKKMAKKRGETFDIEQQIQNFEEQVLDNI